MAEYTTPALNVREVDVLVAGGGVAGFGAALMAARCGVKTLLIESLNAVGGMSTSGLMSHFTGTVDSLLYTEVLERMAQCNEGDMHGKVQRYIDPEQLKGVYLDMLSEAGAELLFYSQACAPMVEEDRITGVYIENKDGRTLVKAKVVIDATGDGDIAARAGVPFVLGRTGDNVMQPATLMFKVDNVDTSRAVFPHSFESLVDTAKGELQALAKKNLPAPAGHMLLYPSPLPGIVTCNMTNCIQIDGTSAADLTRAEITCRQQMRKIIAFLREYAPGYENCRLISSGSMIGVRETRHFEGLETLTEEDILTCRVFPNWIVKGAKFNFDVHNTVGSGLDVTGSQATFPADRFYTIPYGCFVPRTMNGLLLAGRMISGTHIAHSNFRAMPICLAMGEGVGTAAAIAVKNNCEVREVSVEAIQQILLGAK